MGTATLALWLIASPAGAVLVTIGGHTYGVTPIKGVSAESLPAARRLAGRLATPPPVPRNFDGPPKGGGALEYHNGPVMHSVTTYVIYWDPTNTEFTATTKGIVGKFFTDVAKDSGLASNVFAIAGQYKDGTGHAAYSSTFGGQLTDTASYPSSNNCEAPRGDSGPPYTTCLFDSQLQAQLSAYITAERLPTGPTQQYFLLLPHKVVTCFNETLKEEEELGPICSNNLFCAYHSSINGGAGSEIIYSDIPFSLLDTRHAKECQDDGNPAIQLPNGDKGSSNAETRFADVALKYASHEYIEAATDPLSNAYFDSNGNEIGDKCNGVTPDEGEDGIGYDANSFLPTLGGSALAGTLFNQSINADPYYLQSEWDDAAKACLMRPVALTSAINGPASADAGAPVVFEGIATDIYGTPDFTWKWGDGTESIGASPTHAYGLPGTYEVTMTVVDQLTGAAAAPVVHTITVNKGQSIITPIPNSSFAPPRLSVNTKTGAITLSVSLGDPGTFSWLLTFPNGKFGAFASRSTKCKKGFIKLQGKCRPATITFARGRRAVPGAGSLKIKIMPARSALKALKNALKQRKGVPVTAVFTFQSARGGSPVSHTETVTVKLKKK